MKILNGELVAASPAEAEQLRLHQAWASRARSSRPVLRLPVSMVAAIAGHHEYADLPEMLMELLYQDKPRLLANDADILGMQVVTKQQEQWKLMQKAGEQAAGVLMQVNRAAAAGAATASAAADLKKKVGAVVKEAVAAKKISRQEGVALTDSLRHDVDTNFGTRHEGSALDAYERATGWPVRPCALFLARRLPKQAQFCCTLLL
jgi:hypothetical protein